MKLNSACYRIIVYELKMSNFKTSTNEIPAIAVEDEYYVKEVYNIGIKGIYDFLTEKTPKSYISPTYIKKKSVISKLSNKYVIKNQICKIHI